LAGIVTSLLTLPDSHENVAGRPETALFEDSLQLMAPDTPAVIVVVPPEETVAVVAVSPEITGFDFFA
jgi:hypothetical protein